MKSDSDLKQDVENELKWDPSVNEAHIGVGVDSGVVTLSGHVPSYREKFAAEAAAKRIYGVRAVADELDVRLPGSAKRTDADIALACAAALEGNSSIPKDKVKVVVSDGRATLEGELEFQYQKEAAVNAIRCVSGLVGIANNIRITRQATPADVKTKIISAFHRHADIDARRITIEEKDGAIVLSGSVRSWAEKDLAQKAAWSAPGISSVDNRLIVTP